MYNVQIFYCVVLLFLDIPEVQIQLGTSLSHDNIREGSDVYFDCHVRAQPPVYRVEWRHNVRTHWKCTSLDLGHRLRINEISFHFRIKSWDLELAGELS